ncbi:multifunctional CCA tRNA nucleotidyl transferase/2'3'-cyclic phosphodiesterase/2'nucleotidase/phosphatase [Variovorax humicola]|uniref:Multifunctional CCA tRNA nucleotidyl transferase/2'3'-cyclic phosphodiesterase/2'nucleotidase/phosphatase n=1 Tax=Variovorax humicola TaxID=1769758 RepID=A0ABU8VSD0_9BURK
MKTYLVGGALRDRLLGLPVSDRDWLVVGATPEEMTARGYLPVGRDFPVFLHPKTREEHALARTERKSAPGYRGFTIYASPDVTIEEDLARRDLTINAIALPSELADAAVTDAAALVDPFHGQRDLQDKVLRHVTDAFREDPVRILRVARFAARFHDFSVAPETMALMRGMVEAGEVDALVPERVWQELARGLMETMPSRMFAVLQECGAMQRLLPEIEARADRLQSIDRAARRLAPLPVRFSCLTWGIGPSVPGVCDRLRAPTDERDLAVVFEREGQAIGASAALCAADIVALLERCDAIRKPARFAQLLLACECCGVGDAAAAGKRLEAALSAVQAVATDAIARHAQLAGEAGPRIGDAIRRARIAAVAQALA